MAYVRFVSGKNAKLTAEQGLGLYRVLRGLDEPLNEQQRVMAENTRAVYLNWRNAPDYYLLEHKDVLIPIVVGHWMRDKFTGAYTKPEPMDADCWRVSKVLGLMNGLQHTGIVDEMNHLMRYSNAVKK